MPDSGSETEAEYEAVLPRSGPAPARGVAWLDALQGEAAARFDEVGLPTTRLEDWRHTNLARLSKTDWSTPTRAPDVAPEALARLALPDFGGERFIFVDGYFSASLSTAPGFVDGHSSASLSTGSQQASEVGNLADAIATGRDQSDPALAHFARIAEFKDEPITAFNTAHMHDGAIVIVPEGRTLPHPIHVVFLSTEHVERSVAQFPRLLLLAQAGSEASIVIDHVSLRDAESENDRSALTVAVSEIMVERNASLRVVLLQREAPGSVHLARQVVRQQRDSRFAIHTFNISGSLVRNDLEVRLEDVGAECDLFGLFLGDEKQVIDNHTLVDHAMPHTTSRESYKGIVSGESRGVFRGRIIVRPDAQKTVAEQHNSNLVIAPKAEINTQPQLEIYADDVQCSHGSSIGQLDAEALFYMRARGLDETVAKEILSQGFANEITNSLPDGPTRDFVEAVVSHRLQDLFASEVEA